MNQDFKNYYQSNIKLLETHHPKIFKQITQAPPEPIGSISYAPNGKPSLTATNSQGQSITFNHGENYKKESTDFLNKIPQNHKGFVAILGMGLCYSALDILKKKLQIQYLAIFELEPGIFIQTLRHTDLSPILKDPRLILSIGTELGIPEALAKANRTLQLEGANVFHHFASFKFNPKGYNELKDNLFAHLNSLNVGGTTTRVLGHDFLTNRFKHISTIHHHQLLEHLQNKFEGLPAILVAGGPSLDKNIHHLKQVQDKAVIIAVDTVLPTLLKNGIQPHFLTCIDPNNLTYEKFADVASKIKDIALICSSWVNSKTPKIFPAEQTFWTFTAKSMEAWLNFLIGGKLLTSGAGTVAHLNLIAADILGCDPIIFIGQDLAYPQSSTHVKGTVLHGSSPTNIIASNAEGETVKGIDGTMLRTNRSFLSMKAHFETIILNARQTYINATEGGAHIEGTQVIDLQTTIDRYCKTQISISKKLKKHYTSIPAINTGKMLIAFDQMRSKIKHLQKDIKKSDKITLSVLKELKKTGRHQIKSFNMLSQQHQKQINKIDHYHKSIDNALEVWKILEEITMEGLKESERQRQEITIFQNNPAKYNHWLIKNLERLTEINKVRKITLNILETNIDMVISFHKKESSCLKKTNLDDSKEQNLLNLARLYINSGNYYLAKPVVEKLHRAMPESAELYFYLGCIATQYSEHNKSIEHFKTATYYDSKYLEKIDLFRNTLGDEFMNFVRYFKTQPGREESIKYMIFKGLSHCPNHKGLGNELQIMVDKNIETIKLNIEDNNLKQADILLKGWIKNLTDPKKDMAGSISKQSVSAIFLNKGKLYLKEKNYPEAISNFKKALDYSPLEPDLHFLIIDACFVANDFNKAIEALNDAIKVDKQFASYWETIGDSLTAGDQHEDAILAYENCFMYQPENINLLKKIGDCYVATNQLEAAKSAFEQLKLKMKSFNLPKTDNQQERNS